MNTVNGRCSYPERIIFFFFGLRNGHLIKILNASIKRKNFLKCRISVTAFSDPV